MELFFVLVLVLLMCSALASGFPVAFALPGSAILSIALAAGAGWLFAGDVTAYFAQGGPLQWLTAGVTNFRGIYWEPERDTLIAIPLFVFMGIMLQRSRIAEDLLVTMAQLFGPIPGGLGISVVFVGGLLAATTGIVGATVVAMGLISLPAMMRHRYSHPLAAGTIAASGTLGQIIPPSIVLIILADQLANSVDQASSARKSLFKEATGELVMPSEFGISSSSAGDMFMGAVLPGLVLVALYMVFILVVALVRPRLAPPVHFEGRLDWRFALHVAFVLVPPLALIFLVLGSIIMGIATVNQAGAIGAVGATVMAGYRLYEGKRGAYRPAMLALASIFALMLITAVHPINVKRVASEADMIALVFAAVAAAAFVAAVIWSLWRTYRLGNTLGSVMLESAKTTSLVFIILLGAAMLTAAFRGFGGEDLVRGFLTGMPGGFWSQFVIVMAVIFILGFFLDFIEIAVVVVPIVAPILLADPAANVTAVWLGVMIGLNIQTSFLTPPFGFALFYLRGVAPAAVSTVQIYKGVVPFILLQLTALAIAGLAPPLVNYLPTRLSLSSVTAPPPINPRLQICLEDYVFRQYERRGAAIRDAISEARALDFGYLPESLREDMMEGLDKAEATFAVLERIRETEAAVAASAPGYQPLHAEVRSIEREISRLDAEIAALETRIRRLPDQHDPDLRASLERRAASLAAERERLRLAVPPEWEQAHKEFAALRSAADKARANYRRNVDEAYEPVRELIAVASGAERLAALEQRVLGLEEEISGLEPKAAAERVKAVYDALADIEESSAIRTPLSRARRALDAATPDPEGASEQLAAAVAALRADLAWRRRAHDELLPELRRYDLAIRDTIGLRQQPRLPEEQVGEISERLSHHRDISLHF